MTEKTHHILLVEDDERLAKLVRDFLEQHEFTVTVEHRGDTAVDSFAATSPDLMILDLMLPGMDGLEVCRHIRQSSSIPILMLTAKSSDIDQVVGLELGADDYVVKPVEPRVLLARVRALLRRLDSKEKSQPDNNLLEYGQLSLNKTSQSAHLSKQIIDLTTQEFELLWLLANSEGTILSRDDIYHKIKGIDYNGLDRAIDVRISRLRKKLDDNQKKPYRIKTVWGKGYLFVADAWT